MDLDAYLARIGFDGAREPTLGTLRALHLAHPQRIAFENLDPLLGSPVRLDLGSVETKLVREGRGGYCYEHNTLFAAALRAIGFAVTTLAARVLWNQGEDADSPRTHMLLRVDLADGVWLADVGFGALTWTAPLRLAPGLVQETPHGVFRIGETAEGFIAHGLVAGEWRPMHRFDLARQLPADYEIASWYLSTHPASPFRRSLIASRPTPEGRCNLLDNRLTLHRADGATERRFLATPIALRASLERDLAIRLPEDSGLDALLARLAAFPEA